MTFFIFTFDSSLWTRRSDIWYSNSKSDSMSDTATQNTVASIVDGWETCAGSDRTLGSIRLVDDVREPGVLPIRARPWLLQACKLKSERCSILNETLSSDELNKHLQFLPVSDPVLHCEGGHSAGFHIHQTSWELSRSAGGVVMTNQRILGPESSADLCSFCSSVYH